MSAPRPRHVFFLMFSIFLLLNLNYTILRSLRTTLAVVDLGAGAQSIPFFELFGAMPGAVLMTWGIARLMNRYPIHKVFILTMTAFLGFFMVFTFLLYPFLADMQKSGDVGAAAVQVLVMLFYVVAELWKPGLAIVLFWGLINQYLLVDEAKKLYAPLMLGGSLGAIVAGPLIGLCTSESFWMWFPVHAERWTHGLNLMVLFITVIGVIAGFLYYILWRCFDQYSQKYEAGAASDIYKGAISFKNSLLACIENKQLRLLSWIVIADYIAYSLGEVIFLDVLHIYLPNSSDYCAFMGNLSLWGGVLTFILSLFVTPMVLQHCRWVVAALVMPICLLLIN